MTTPLLFDTSISHCTLHFKETELNEKYAARKPISFLLLMAIQMVFILFGMIKALHLRVAEGTSLIGFYATTGLGIFQLVFEWALYRRNQGQMLRGYTIVLGNAIGCVLVYNSDVSDHLDTHVPFMYGL